MSSKEFVLAEVNVTRGSTGGPFRIALNSPDHAALGEALVDAFTKVEIERAKRSDCVHAKECGLHTLARAGQTLVGMACGNPDADINECRRVARNTASAITSSVQDVVDGSLQYMANHFPDGTTPPF